MDKKQSFTRSNIHLELTILTEHQINHQNHEKVNNLSITSFQIQNFLSKKVKPPLNLLNPPIIEELVNIQSIKK